MLETRMLIVVLLMGVVACAMTLVLAVENSKLRHELERCGAKAAIDIIRKVVPC